MDRDAATPGRLEVGAITISAPETQTFRHSGFKSQVLPLELLFIATIRRCVRRLPCKMSACGRGSLLRRPEGTSEKGEQRLSAPSAPIRGSPPGAGAQTPNRNIRLVLSALQIETEAFLIYLDP